MYYTENNHNKVVLRDFYLSRFENGPITDPCGTPEYLGRTLSINHYFAVLFIPASLLSSLRSISLFLHLSGSFHWLYLLL